MLAFHYFCVFISISAWFPPVRKWRPFNGVVPVVKNFKHTEIAKGLEGMSGNGDRMALKQWEVFPRAQRIVHAVTCSVGGNRSEAVDMMCLLFICLSKRVTEACHDKGSRW